MAGSATAGSGNSSSLICGARSGSLRVDLIAFGLRLSQRPPAASCAADHVEPPRGPQRGAAIETHRAERIGLGEPLDAETRQACDRRQPFDAGKTIAARGDEFFQFVFAQAVNEAKAQDERACLPSAAGSSVQSQSLKLTSTARISTPCCARIAHQLRRLIEAHRLAVEDGGAEHVRIVAFDPGRGIDEERKARRVAFGKAVFAEAFDLAEAVFGEVAVVAAAVMPSMNLSRNRCTLPLWRKVAMARRSPSASSGVNFAAVIAICIACS